MLYSAVLRYRYHDMEMSELLRAVERGEEIIDGHENDDAPSIRQIRESLTAT